MSNIFRRRTVRKALPYIIIGGGALLIGGIVVLIILLSKGCSKSGNTSADVPEETVREDVASETPFSEPTNVPVQTDEPSPEPSEHIPRVISDELSSVLLTMTVGESLDEEGVTVATASGSLCARFVNNTDSDMYSALFDIEGLGVTAASVDGLPARFSLMEDGKLEIPFIKELGPGESCEIYFDFETKAFSDILQLPSLGYDSDFELTAFIGSRYQLVFSGATASTKVEMHGYSYAIRGAAVRSVGITAVIQK